MTNQYRYGRSKEELVARHLRGHGAQVDMSQGSKGAADLAAKFPTGTKWKVQVKSSRTSASRKPCDEELRRLKISATKSRATGVVACVMQNEISFESVRDGRKLTPPNRSRK